ncbi:MAG: hypothetical protein FJY34_09400 [Betaproteobacteria bacterium]|nr:hypothetical protein [Betaproteobacteria bacterium]
MTARLTAWVQAVGAVRTAFFVSLLLSWVALQGALLNRDGILYVDVARAMLEEGFLLRHSGIDWQFLSLLMAGLSALTGLAPEAAGHFLNAVFLAGACSLLVAITRQRMPEAAWAACLVVLAMPAYNGYRDMLLREYGFWFFCTLAFWLAMRWEASGRQRDALACQLALGIAALFRLEAVVLYPALMLWQVFAAPAGQRLRRALSMGWLPLAAAALGAILVGSGFIALPGRVNYYLEAANPLRTLQILNEAGSRMSELVFKYKYSREEAGYILFFGLLSVIPVKFLTLSGVFVAPLAYGFMVQPARAALARWQPLPWIFLAYLLVLAAFVTHQFFLVGRYVSFLNMLAVPVVAVGLAQLMKRFPGWRWLILALAVITLLANVVSVSPRKTHIVEAGRWLGANVSERQQVCLVNSRIAYYANWPTSGIVFEDAQLDRLIADRRCIWTAIETRKKENLAVWLQERRLQEVRRFVNAAGEAVVIARREGM